MKELKVSTRDQEGGITIIDLDGSVEKQTTPALEKVMSGLSDKGRQKIIVNCDRLLHFSSDGMGIFLSHLIKIRKTGGDIKFCNMREEARTVLTYLGLGKLLTVRDTERDAIADFRKSEARKDPPKEPEKLRIEVEEKPGVTVVILFGFIDRHTIEVLDKVLRGLLDRGQTHIVVDCAELTYVSSIGMGVFISYGMKVRNAGGDLRFASMREIAKTVMVMIGLHRLFQVFETRDAALASFKSP